MQSMTNHLFEQTEITCPKCPIKLNRLNSILICEGCGWYHIKHNDKKGGIKTVRIGDFKLGEKHEKPFTRQYAKDKLKHFNNNL